MAVVFIALLVSAYSQYQSMLSTAGLVDTTSTITNDLVLNSLALEEGSRTREYVVDSDEISSLDFMREVGGDNFEFQIKITYNQETEVVLGPYGPSPPDGRPVSALSVPVTIYENGRLTYAKMEVKVWRA
ncbi:MAG: hypothetical protein ABH852_01045 [Methanobacteriota archaeon]